MKVLGRIVGAFVVGLPLSLALSFILVTGTAAVMFVHDLLDYWQGGRLSPSMAYRLTIENRPFEIDGDVVGIMGVLGIWPFATMALLIWWRYRREESARAEFRRRNADAIRRLGGEP